MCQTCLCWTPAHNSVMPCQCRRTCCANTFQKHSVPGYNAALAHEPSMMPSACRADDSGHSAQPSADCSACCSSCHGALLQQSHHHFHPTPAVHKELQCVGVYHGATLKTCMRLTLRSTVQHSHVPTFSAASCFMKALTVSSSFTCACLSYDEPRLVVPRPVLPMGGESDALVRCCEAGEGAGWVLCAVLLVG